MALVTISTCLCSWDRASAVSAVAFDLSTLATLANAVFVASLRARTTVLRRMLPLQRVCSLASLDAVREHNRGAADHSSNH